MRELLALLFLVSMTAAAAADPITAYVLTALGATTLAANATAVSLITFAVTAMATGGGVFNRRRRP